MDSLSWGMRFHPPSKANLLFQSFFWVAYFIFAGVVTYGLTDGNLMVAIPIAVMNTIFHIGMVNIHLYFLLPNFWRQRKKVLHMLLTLALLVLVSFFKWGLVMAVGPESAAPPDALGSAPVVAVISSLFVFVVSLPFIFFDSILEKEKLKAELQSQTYQSEIRFLRAQMNPHFLFNVLNNIYSMVFTGSDEAGPTVLKLSELMRYMLYDTDGGNVSLLQEAAYLEKFIALQTMKQGERPTVHFEVGEIPPRAQIPPLLLVSFLENAFKHSNWDAEDGKGFIKGGLWVKENTLHLELSNSIGPKRVSTGHGGIGLTNTSQRLELLFPKKHLLLSEESEGIYKVLLTIQLNSKSLPQ